MTPSNDNDTIYAPATGVGAAGLQVVRLSGPGAAKALAALTGGRAVRAREATLVRLSDSASGEILDRAIAIRFAAPASFTGEDVVELHLHGGRAVLRGVMAALSGLDGLRVAEPGEFTWRAFHNDRMDLTEAEAVADLVAAETAAQRRLALDQMTGSLRRLYEDWRERLTRGLAYREAAIDFDDQDLPDGFADPTHADLVRLAQEIDAHLDDSRRGEILRDGLHVAILGPPNVGKSSLLNRLAGRDAAIVSEHAGTTRDVIEVRMDLGGWPVVLSDTAGLRDSDDAVEREGVRRARDRAARADLRLILFDATALARGRADRNAVELLDETALAVVSKADLATAPETVDAKPALAISARTGAGLEALSAALERAACERLETAPGTGPVLTRARHRRALQECRDALRRGAAADLAELAAEDARLASRALGRITGRVDVEDLLDVIFRDFCIGK